MHRSLGRLLALLLVVSLPRPVVAECLKVVCNGETTELRITINRQDPPPEAGTELLVMGTRLGSCAPATLLTSEGVPFVNPEPFVGFETYVVIIPTPFDGAATRYEIVRRYPDGSTGPASTCGDPLPVDFEGCEEEWLVGRARITGMVFVAEPPTWSFEYTFCVDACWTELPLRFATDAAVDDVTIGSHVELHGTLFVSGMPGESIIDVSRVVEIEDRGTCGVVSSRSRSWGSLKSRFD